MSLVGQPILAAAAFQAAFSKLWTGRVETRLQPVLAAPLLLLLLAANFEESGQIVGLADSPSDRLNAPHLIAPGAPPVLSFRYFDASDRGRFGNLGLMTDDAGH
jgi:hypothetical protein